MIQFHRSCTNAYKVNNNMDIVDSCITVSDFSLEIRLLCISYFILLDLSFPSSNFQCRTVVSTFFNSFVFYCLFMKALKYELVLVLTVDQPQPWVHQLHDSLVDVELLGLRVVVILDDPVDSHEEPRPRAVLAENHQRSARCWGNRSIKSCYGA